MADVRVQVDEVDEGREVSHGLGMRTAPLVDRRTFRFECQDWLRRLMVCLELCCLDEMSSSSAVDSSARVRLTDRRLRPDLLDAPPHGEVQTIRYFSETNS